MKTFSIHKESRSFANKFLTSEEFIKYMKIPEDSPRYSEFKDLLESNSTKITTQVGTGTISWYFLSTFRNNKPSIFTIFIRYGSIYLTCYNIDGDRDISRKLKDTNAQILTGFVTTYLRDIPSILLVASDR